MTPIRPMLGLLLLAALLTVIATTAWAAPRGPGTYGQDLAQLLAVSDDIMTNERTVIIKHTSAYHPFGSKNEFMEMGERISHHFNIASPHTQLVQNNDHLLYQAELLGADGVQRTILWIGFQDGSSQLTATAKVDHSEEMRALQQVQNDMTAQLEALDVTPDWCVTIQGAAKVTDTRQELLFSKLFERLQAAEIGRYQDAGSVSVSYHVPTLSQSNSAIGDADAMNLQVAVHRDSMTLKQRVTIGMPAISIEY
ncbi:YwmB family TATA-box binding protein [Paenibacillus xerothermodurans]|uniref:TATA-box binding protein n=1 Tax=Paenibacillus xerothermodurans TaxID=1977292 RepID=A0A2W1NLC0_PAEXE|nr:YwmB family TATA-box binding protein [Paenibacillus xerothermodurans]PZE19793.1 hypothetical protein CBW46_016770 [Paenibacillus xerothermodurans]